MRIRTDARQIIAESRVITCTALNLCQRRSLIKPCMRSRTAPASGAPGAIACAK
jgi:hypothetical protein